MKDAEVALAPLREVGRILNYIDDWLILAHLCEQGSGAQAQCGASGKVLSAIYIWASSIMQPTNMHISSRSRENGDSTTRRSS